MCSARTCFVSAKQLGGTSLYTYPGSSAIATADAVTCAISQCMIGVQRDLSNSSPLHTVSCLHQPRTPTPFLATGASIRHEPIIADKNASVTNRDGLSLLFAYVPWKEALPSA